LLHKLGSIVSFFDVFLPSFYFLLDLTQPSSAFVNDPIGTIPSISGATFGKLLSQFSTFFDLPIRIIRSIPCSAFSEPVPNRLQPIPVFRDVSRFPNSPNSVVPRFARPYHTATVDLRPQRVESELCLESLTLYELLASFRCD
jgi:hypothetical protein